ncbi:NUC091 domain-containing protein [Mycena alexandri]|uniref:Nucleolar GTP-binding protein 2 n=1 Tax=Mycena alexandri TaxID=1745969 RepID=A0AAD6WQ87_9AGAR|nr:NUC091 domain-containing protein [Mycena alexandri]
MAPTKKATGSPSKTRSSGSKVSLARVKGENFLPQCKAGRPPQDAQRGETDPRQGRQNYPGGAFQKGEDETKPGRVQPDRRWFGNTRVISQTALDHFRTSLLTKKDDPYSVLLRRNKLPMALLDDAANPNLRKRPHIVEVEPFGDTFGPKAQRKRPRIEAGSFDELSKLGAAAEEEGCRRRPRNGHRHYRWVMQRLASSIVEPQTHADYHEPIYAKGTSRRIYGELYKVIDSSDTPATPLGTICESVLEYVKKEKSHKQIVLVINKCDLVPNWVTARYIQHLTPRYPTICLLRQFAQLHSDKKQISVGFIGYPNVGKSSVINTLKSGKVCRVAPVPGETKVWQYITLTRRIYLIDCPGIVPTSAHDTETSTVLKGVVRVEALPTPSDHIPALMARDGAVWAPEEFLDKLARMKGRLLKHGEPDLDAVAKIVLSDWVRGRIPFFVAPPERSEELNKTEARERVRAEKAKGKGKGKAVEGKAESGWKGLQGKDGEVPGVRQNLGTIMQKNTFVAEDVQPLDDQFVGPAAAAEPEEEDEGGDEDEGEDDEPAEEEEELTWNDVWDGIKEDGAEKPQGEADADDEGAAGSSKKEPRMKTNKKKAENFYSGANVKNKNRSKSALLKSLPHGKRGAEGRGRRKD